MNFELLVQILSVVGSIAIGLPLFLRASVAFFKRIPGEQPDRWLEKILAFSEMIAELIGRFYPAKK